MDIDELKALQASGEFHHATYRNIGNLWEGLYIYKRDPDGFRGFSLAGAFSKRLEPQTLEDAMALCRNVSVGSFGAG